MVFQLQLYFRRASTTPHIYIATRPSHLLETQSRLEPATSRVRRLVKWSVSCMKKSWHEKPMHDNLILMHGIFIFSCMKMIFPCMKMKISPLACIFAPETFTSYWAVFSKHGIYTHEKMKKEMGKTFIFIHENFIFMHETYRCAAPWELYGVVWSCLGQHTRPLGYQSCPLITPPPPIGLYLKKCKPFLRGIDLSWRILTKFMRRNKQTEVN